MQIRQTGGNVIVLVIDDELMVREYVRKTLEHKGYRVITAESGAAGIEVFANISEDIDLVILDLTMPGMGGAETFRRLLALQPGVAVIISSGYNSAAATQTLTGVRGVASFLQKPFTTTQLLLAVEAALNAAVHRAR